MSNPLTGVVNAELRKHAHYFKPVANLTEIDIYRVCDLFAVDDPSGATQHAIKKLLLPGQRGAKDRRKDLQEAIDTLQRRLQMLDEDGCADGEAAGWVQSTRDRGLQDRQQRSKE